MTLAFKRSSSGFTLIELLIVMTIVGLSVSMVGPSLYKQYEKARANQQIQKVELTFKYLAELAFYNYRPIEVETNGREIKAYFVGELTKGKAQEDGELEEESNKDEEDVNVQSNLLFSQEFKDVFIAPQTLIISGNGIPSIPAITVTQNETKHEIRLHHVVKKTNGNDAN